MFSCEFYDIFKNTIFIEFSKNLDIFIDFFSHGFWFLNQKPDFSIIFLKKLEKVWTWVN